MPLKKIESQKGQLDLFSFFKKSSPIGLPLTTDQPQNKDIHNAVVTAVTKKQTNSESIDKVIVTPKSNIENKRKLSNIKTGKVIESDEENSDDGCDKDDGSYYVSEQSESFVGGDMSEDELIDTDDEMHSHGKQMSLSKVARNLNETMNNDSEGGKRLPPRKSSKPVNKRRKTKLLSSTSHDHPHGLTTPASMKSCTTSSTGSYSNTKSILTTTPMSTTNMLTPIKESPDMETSSTGPVPEGALQAGSHEHNYFDFLQPSIRRDKSGHVPSHPQYNPRTLWVPEKFLRDQTPGMSQWWSIKSENMDVVLFFKIGKFYELYHMDADVGVSELDLIYMKGSKAHSGFPEICYGKNASALVSKGYKVARVEQTETPEMMKDRNDSAKSSGQKKSKVVSRELCSILSKGTRTYCHLDDRALLYTNKMDQSRSWDGESDLNNAKSYRYNGSVLLCIKEKPSSAMDTVDHRPEYGICCIDATIGTIMFAQFEDNSQRTRLRTLITQMNPNEVLLEAAVQDDLHSSRTVDVVKLLSPQATIDWMYNKDMPTANETVQMIVSGKYFPSVRTEPTPSQTTTGSPVCTASWPVILKAVYDGLHDANGSSELTMCAFGGCIWKLKRSVIDYEVISLGKLYAYIPPDLTEPSTEPHQGQSFSDSIVGCLDNGTGSSNGLWGLVNLPHGTANDTSRGCMVLDEIALSNLEVLVNNHNHTEKGSLLAFLNRCRTPFGQRLIRTWLCHPLYQVEDITFRSDAVQELLTHHSDIKQSLSDTLKTIPDLERLLTRVHSNGLSRKAINHPDCRAVMYEASVYNTRKIRDFADILQGFELTAKVVKMFSHRSIQSVLLKSIVSSDSLGGDFPLVAMDGLLKHYREIFDEQQAKRDGCIKPRPGVDAEYDAAKEDISAIEMQFEKYLKDMKKCTGISELKYFGSNKDRYQLEVSMALAHKVPKEWMSKSQKKTHRRYRTPVVENLFDQLTKAEDRLEAAQKDTLRRIFEKFDESRPIWDKAWNCIATLDALLSLVTISSMPGYVWPTIISSNQLASSYDIYGCNNGRPDSLQVLEIQGGRHPMLELSLMERGDGDYIPNDIALGGCSMSNDDQIRFNAKLLLLSGPNMGGKSTLLRQTCLITIMAQIGCKVPANECKMTPVDRIFTRVGASDRILSGQSTLYVELAETASILTNATEHSLCILDELGRGTSTFDGTAIAHSVVDSLVRKKRCRALFATHYHSLVDDWEIDPRVKLGHMDCIVNHRSVSEQTAADDGEATGVNSDPEVTFLYKLCEGSSPKSYGINVARLAGLPEDVIQLAIEQSEAFQMKMKKDAQHGMDEGQLQIKTHSMKISRIFDHVVSIVHGELSPQEVLFMVKEMWKNFSKEII